MPPTFTRVLVGLQRLCVAFAAAVHQISPALFEPIHGKGWARTVAQQALQPCAVWCFDHTPASTEKPPPWLLEAARSLMSFVIAQTLGHR